MQIEINDRIYATVYESVNRFLIKTKDPLWSLQGIGQAVELFAGFLLGAYFDNQIRSFSR